MITLGLLNRVVKIRFNARVGTAFIYDYENRQYLITSLELVESIQPYDNIELFRGKKFEPQPVRLVGLGEIEMGNDIAVLALSYEFVRDLSSVGISGQLGYGQQVFMLGFSKCSKMNTINEQRYPTPLIKSANFSGILDHTETLLIDQSHDVGFSGGPVLFNPYGSERFEYNILGVISNLSPENRNEDDNSQKFIKVDELPQFTCCVAINHAISIILKNPVGPMISG